jgi:NADH:ubiquinone reductase (H+-translocating)
MKRTRTLGIALAGGAGLGLAGLAWRRRDQAVATPPPDETAPHVVILGAGFAGVAAARRLHARLGPRVRITLVDRHNYHLFTPMLYQVAALTVDPYDAAFPLRELARGGGIRFRRAQVAGIDFAARRVRLDPGSIDYDYLLIALGATTNFFGNAAAGADAFPLKWLEDGIAVRNHVLDMLEQASQAQGDERRALLTFAIVGGGATGVETAGALATFLRRVTPEDYPALGQDRPRVVVIESEGRLLGHMDSRMAAIALRDLRALGVDVWLNAKAQDVTTERVTTDDGRCLPARTTLWTTGVRAPDVVRALDAAHGKGGSLAVDQFLQAPGKQRVYAAGDNAHVPNPGGQGSVPLLAAAAVQEGEAVAENIARAIAAQSPLPFHYRDLGSVVSLGHGRGVAQIGGAIVHGFPGWLAWRLIHLTRITSFRNKLATALDWSISYFYDWDTARLDMKPAGRPVKESAKT